MTTQINTFTETEQQDIELSAHKVKLEAKYMALFPTLDSLQAVVDLAVTQLPIGNKNTAISVLMTYHNTLLAQLAKEGKKS